MSPKTLPPFSGDNPTCIKCGNEGACTEWKAAEMLGPSYLQWERLTRRCVRCGYEWDEACIPAVATPVDLH